MSLPHPHLDTSGVPINAHGGGLCRFGDLWHLYGEHKIAGPLGNTAQVGVHLYTSPDLVHWTDRGIVLAVSDTPGHPIERGCILERPKVVCAPATGKYVMWFHLELKGQGYRAARVGVAVAETPQGPFRFVRDFRPDAGHPPLQGDPTPLTPAELAHLASFQFNGGPLDGYPTDLIYRRDLAGGQMSRDQTLFHDDDGTVYHVRASEENGTLHISELTADGLSTTGRWARAMPGRFHEAPALFRHAGRYYLITSGCTGWAPNAARLSVAPHPLGPWTELGNPCRGKGAEITFGAQGTAVIESAPGQFHLLADRWCPDNPVDGTYLLLPIDFDPDGTPCMPPPQTA